MSEPAIAQKEPIAVMLEKGKKYAWCACGLSRKQPFCDGSHKTTELKPVVFQAEADEEVYFCCCKQSKDKPYCDGTHNGL